MTDALTKAERLLRGSHHPFCDFRRGLGCSCGNTAARIAAADALAAERERRGKPEAWLNVSQRKWGVHRVLIDGSTDPRVVHDNGGEYFPLYAAPPLPPATAPRDNGGMTGAFLVVNKSDGRVMGDCSTLAEAEALRRDCTAADEASEYAVASFVPPATGRDDLQDLKKMLARYNSDATLGDIVDKWAAFARPTPEPSEAMVEAARSLYAEVDCRIEHGADSGGHLEFVRDKLRAALAAQEGA